jgi:phage tail-like protein
MSFSNQEYLYQHLPSRFRREDKDLFLKRYLQWFGETLDVYDDKFETFSENINPDTASTEWIEFWLENLFDWSWFPSWFTLSDKRRLYGNFARHLARRGTRRGIELWIADFRIHARVYTRPAFVGDVAWGELDLFVTEPLLILIEIFFAEMEAKTEMCSVGDAAWGEGFYIEVPPLFTSAEVEALLRFVQPQAQEILMVTRHPPAGTQYSILCEYSITNFTALRTLDGNNVELEDLINLACTVAWDLSCANGVLSGYTVTNFLPLRVFNGNTAELEDAANFLMTLVFDRTAGNPLSNYSAVSYAPVRNLDGMTSQLDDAINFLATLATDLMFLEN